MVLIGEGFVRDALLLRANSLAYLTLLSIVPLLALGVALVDLVGSGKEVAEQLLDLLAVAPEAKLNFLARVESFNFKTLGGVASGVLLATMVLAVGRVEHALNALWGVTERRPWSRRIPDYLAVIVVTPLFVGVAVSLRASFESQTLVQKALEFPLLELFYRFGLRWAPLLLITAAFGFLYWFLPNTRVRKRSALFGAVVGAVLFNAAQVAYVHLTLGAKERMDEAFAASAWVVMFLIWVYISWAIVLLGAEAAYAHQTLSLYRREVRGKSAGPAARETIGLAIALCCARAFRDRAQPWHPDALSDALDIPLRTVRDILRALEEANIVAPCGGESAGCFQMARPIEQVRVADVLIALRGAATVPLGVADLSRTVNGVIADVERAASVVAEARNLRDLIGDAPAA
ncbi:MAG: YihY family inner membrane protein [Deltaproteobacteria bacterium]|nr:YihY family inner membrane protein [Deltaproteobacteria bacterium]